MGNNGAMVGGSSASSTSGACVARTLGRMASHDGSQSLPQDRPKLASKYGLPESFLNGDATLFSDVSQVGPVASRSGSSVAEGQRHSAQTIDADGRIGAGR